MSFLDTVIIVAITIIAVGGVKLGYAFLADRARLLISAKLKTRMNLTAGCILIAVGVFLLTKA